MHLRDVTDQTTNLVSIGHKPAQTLEVFRSILEAGVSKPIEIAKEMKLPDYTISRLAKKAELAGWLKKSSRGEYVLVGGRKMRNRLATFLQVLAPCTPYRYCNVQDAKARGDVLPLKTRRLKVLQALQEGAVF